MNWITIGIGIASVAYGIYTFILRMKAPEKFGKLEAMKSAWGEKAGFAIHFVGYTIVPVVFGISSLIAGINGVAFFGN